MNTLLSFSGIESATVASSDSGIEKCLLESIIAFFSLFFLCCIIASIILISSALGMAPFGFRYMTTESTLGAGLKLVPEDKPSKLYTHEDTQIHKPGVFLTAGTAAPDFVTMDINHKPVKLSDFRGKVLVLDFWATWCGPCQASMPHTQEVSEKYKDQGVVVLGVCTEDKRDKYEAWVQKNQSKYPGILFTHDPATKASEYASSKVFGVPGIPTQFVIGADGTIVSTVVGYLKGEVILEGALAKAGIKVDPALVAKAAEDLKNR